MTNYIIISNERKQNSIMYIYPDFFVLFQQQQWHVLIRLCIIQYFVFGDNFYTLVYFYLYWDPSKIVNANTGTILLQDTEMLTKTL